MNRNLEKAGFTIVELLIVIVVIVILAAIATVAYTNMSARANDARRMQDVSSIRKALDLYKIDNGQYPNATANPGIASWEVSTDPNFLTSLSSVANSIPVDPVNDALSYSYYAYYRYPAGSHGCPASAGAFYVLRIARLQSLLGTNVSDQGVCAGLAVGATRVPGTSHAVFYGFEG